MIDSQQNLITYQDVKMENTGWSEAQIRDYMGKYEDVITLLNLVNNGDLSPIVSTGSPEGLIASNYSLKYIDSSVPTEYYNPIFGVKTGWVAL